MDEKLTQLLTQFIEAQTAAQETEARKAQDAAQAAQMAQFVTMDAMKAMFEEFGTKLGETIEAKMDAKIEAAVPVRAEGAGRAAAPVEGDAQKAEDVVAALAKTPVDQLTAEQKELKARIVSNIALKGMK